MGEMQVSDLTVLYVEDNAEIREELSDMLGYYFSNVLVACDGLVALDIYEQNHIDLLITDIQMPHMDGLELSKQIKSKEPSFPIMVVTAFNDSEYLMECINIGIDGYLTKPIYFESLDKELKKKIADITLKKAFDANEQLLQEYKDAADEATIFSKTDPKGLITYVNENFCTLSGFRPEELIGKNHNIVRHPDTPKETFEQMWRCIKAKKTWHGKMKNRKKDGGYYWVDATIKPILNADGEIIEYVGLRHDITELEDYKQMLKSRLDDTSKDLQVQQSYVKQYEEAIAQAVAILRTDANNIINDVNERFLQLSGYGKDELIGIDCKNIRHEEHILAKDCEKIHERLKSNESVSMTFKNIAKDGSIFITETLIYPIVNTQGAVTQHLHLMHDVTKITNINIEIENTQKEIIYKMGEIGESRSQETGNHVKRVAEFSKLLALLYGLDKHEAEVLLIASPMHDIGKVAIPDSILKKPARLNDAEMDVMKTHAKIGYEVLKDSKREILKAAATLAHEHHEKWDGSGYPRGLKGEQIHIYARITALADVFDALGHDRVYKKAWPLKDILEYFQAQSAKHFDPDLVRIFIENLDKFLQISERFVDNRPIN